MAADGGEESKENEDAEGTEPEEEGEVNPKEYEYLLGMPMWSVTEERVIQLERQMREKKHEYDVLKEKPIHALWTEDLDAFLVELKRVWAKEEDERLKLGGVKNDGKGRKGAKKRAPAKKGATGKPAAASKD